MELIDKSALIAEIEKLYNGEIDTYTRNILDRLKSNIDTLEVKEVDLEKEYKDFVEKDPVYNMLVNGIVGRAIAKHFFELGLKVQK